MPITLNIIRQRKHRRDRSRRSTEGRTGRAVFVAGFVLTALLVLGLVAGALVYADLTSNLPSIEAMPILLNPVDGLLLEPTRLFDRSGEHLLAVVAPVETKRTYVPYDQFPQVLIDATIALVDPDFRSHGGYRLEGWRDPASHPTLAQNLAADLLLWDEAPLPRRGLRERLLAAQLTAEYGRDRIMEWYLNSADYGRSAFGAETAAELYFGKSVTGLDLGESALLAALSQAPALNPFDAPEAAEGLRQLALQEMLTQGFISADEAADAAARPVAILFNSAETQIGDEAAFVNLVLDQLGQRFHAQRIRRGGLTVVTTLDQDLQLQTACTIRNQLAHLAGQSGSLPAADGSDCQATKYLPSSLSVEPSLPEASASAIILDPRSGQVLAAVGDMRGGEAGAYLQQHPAGTLLTPFLYLTGFTRGLGPASLGWDIPGVLANFDGQYRGPVRLRIALVNDYLPPAAAVLEQMGAESVGRIAAPFGLKLPSGATILQDEILISPLDAAAAYGVFAYQGTLAGQVLSGEAINPVTVLKVSGGDGAVWVDWTTPQVQAVVSPQLAYMMTDILSDDTARWPTLGDPNLLDLERPAAAKVSRTFDLSAAWTTGYTPQHVAVVYFSGAESMITQSVDLWHALMAIAVENLPQESWIVPAGLTTVSVCDPSGFLPTETCPNVVSEVFLSGSEPIQVDMLYQSFEVDRETGLLATVFTPPELVESRTYLVVPPEARLWAEGMNLPVPPTEYDSLQVPEIMPEVNITAPLLFSQVSGLVEVRGTATGAEFASYRLEYGQGLNPQAWFQIGGDSTTSVDGDVLGTWDTSGLNGLYALRLLVVHADQRVWQAVVMVTVKNP